MEITGVTRMGPVQSPETGVEVGGLWQCQQRSCGITQQAYDSGIRCSVLSGGCDSDHADVVKTRDMDAPMCDQVSDICFAAPKTEVTSCPLSPLGHAHGYFCLTMESTRCLFSPALHVPFPS